MFTAQNANHGPMAIRYPRGDGFNAEWQTPMRALEIGKGEKLCDGSDVVIISVGTMAKEVNRAIKVLQLTGISVAHYDAVFIKPLDNEMMEEIARKGLPIVTVEDGAISGGFGSTVMEWLGDHGYHLQVKRIGVPDRFIAHGTVAQLKKICGMDSESIANEIIKMKMGNK